MGISSAIPITNTKQLYTIAFLLAIITIICSCAEAIASGYFGYEDGSLTLLGFGTDSFIEIISGLGIANMVLRIQRQPSSNRNNFERTSLKITGYAFYFLVVALVLSAVYNLWIGHKPTATISGIVISLITIVAMLVLIYGKLKVGKQLNSNAILADAECTRICIYMSLVLLASSGIYELTKISFVDSLGTLGLAYFSFKEGKECFEKAKSNKLCCEHD